MTPEEQDVYALMGSPLVRLNRGVKNLWSVIVNVTLPGQLPAIGTFFEENGTESESTLKQPADSTLLPVKLGPRIRIRLTQVSHRFLRSNENEATSEVPVNRRRRRSLPLKTELRSEELVSS